MASRMAVEAEIILDSPSARLTAVAVSVRAGHTIAFLGDSKGNLHKVTWCHSSGVFLNRHPHTHPKITNKLYFVHVVTVMLCRDCAVIAGNMK